MRRDIAIALITAVITLVVSWAGSVLASTFAAPQEIAVLKTEVKHLSDQINRLTEAMENFNLRVDAILEKDDDRHANPTRR